MPVTDYIEVDVDSVTTEKVIPITIKKVTAATGSAGEWDPNTYEQLRLPLDDEDEFELESLEEVEQVIIEKEYDEHGNVTKETRTTFRPKVGTPPAKIVPVRTPPPMPKPTPIPYQPFNPSPYWTPNQWQTPVYPSQPQIWCGGPVLNQVGYGGPGVVVPVVPDDETPWRNYHQN